MPEAERPSVRWPLLLGIAVAVVAAAACALIFRNEFTQDDVSLLVSSRHFTGADGWTTLVSSSFWPPPAGPWQYQPLHATLLALENVAGAGMPTLFRIVSMLLYVAASVAVFGLARRWLTVWPAFIAAALFAAHPLHVEAITLAVAQNELLAGLLLALAVARYLRARERGEVVVRDWSAIGVMYAVALFSNETAIVLPLLIGVAERLWPGGAPARRQWPGYAALAGIAATYLVAHAAVLHGAFAAPVVADAIAGRGLGGRMLTMLGVVPHWVRLLVWPVHLRADYSPQVIVGATGFGAAEAIGLGLLLVGVAVAWRARRAAPAVTFGLAWTGIGLLPVANIIPGPSILSERTLFVASIGAVIATVAAVDWLARASAARGAMVRRVAVTAAGVLCLLGVARSLLRERDWQNGDALIAASVRDSPRSWIAQQSYGDLMFDMSKPFDAIAHYQKAVEYAPEPWRVHNRLGIRLRMIDNDLGAAHEFQKSLAKSPRMETAVQLVAALISLGSYAEARHLADSAIATGNAPPTLVTMRALADTAIIDRSPPGSLHVPIPR